MSTIKICIVFTDDYRQGRHVHFYDEDTVGDDDSQEYLHLEFSLTNKYNLFIVKYNYYDLEIIGTKDYEHKKDAENGLLKAFSQVNDCLPFHVTGYTSSYKEKGYYPDVPDNIKSLPDIDFPDDFEDCYLFGVIFDDYGLVIEKEMIHPTF
jgi:hypothetical protein